jgi:hypothetical protein
MDHLVKVRSFLGVAEAELARIRLAMDGISARLSNAEMVIWFWHYSNVTGGVKLFVNESDASKAVLILSPNRVPQLFQPPKWICPKCHADVEGLWSYCWSCGTSKQGEEDADFHAWYMEPANHSFFRISNTNTIAAIISAMYLVFFISIKYSPFVILAWLITLILWVVIARCLSVDKEATTKAADSSTKIEGFSNPSYDVSSDEFNESDQIAFRLWKATIFSLYSVLLFPFALWLLYKTSKKAIFLSPKGILHYYYSMYFLILNVVFYGWILLWLIKSQILYLWDFVMVI